MKSVYFYRCNKGICIQQAQKKRQTLSLYFTPVDPDNWLNYTMLLPASISYY